MAKESKPNHKDPLPPEDKRWKKGVSGNPKGRPRKELSLTTLLKSEIEKTCPADKQGRSWLELIVLATLQQALKGNPSVLKEVWERIDGKILQPGKLEVNGPGGKEVTIKVVYGEDNDESQANSKEDTAPDDDPNAPMPGDDGSSNDSE